MKQTLPFALLATSLLGCADELPERWFDSLNFRALDVADRQVFVSRAAQRAVVLDPVRDGGEIRLDIAVHPVGTDAGASAVSADGTAYYVVDEANAELHITQAATGERTTVALDSPFDRIAVDPHGEFLMLYFSGTSDGAVVARNLNEVGIVDLRGEPSAAFLTLSSRPIAVEFAPPFAFGSQDQRLAVVSSVNEITVLDLEELDDPEEALREVPLTISEADAVRQPASIAFDVTPLPEEPNVVRIYVLAERSDDITEISVQPAVLPEATRKLDLAVNQLAAGTSPRRMELLELPAGTRLLAIDGQRPRFTLIDVASGESATFDLPMSAPATELVVFDTTTEVDGSVVPERRVLAFSPTSPLVAVIRPETIAVSGDEPTLGRSVEAIRLERNPSRIELATGQPDRAIAFHQGPSAGFTILDLRKNNDIPIQGGTLSDIHFDGDFAYAVFGALDGFTIFGLDGHPLNYELPAPGADVFLDAEDGLLLIRHDDPTGMFTVLDATEPSPSTARVYNQVFLHQLLDQEIAR